MLPGKYLTVIQKCLGINGKVQKNNGKYLESTNKSTSKYEEINGKL